MLKLDKRLSLIASFTAAGSSVCDVGCDHGYLSAFLCLRGDLKSICATDINEKPLENARKTFRKYGIEGVKLYKCDGLSGLSRADADTVIIAGMGGDVISGIIERAAFLKDKTVTLILQPMTSADSLREYLAQNGFCVFKEQAVSEGKKVYSVMCARFNGNKRNLGESEKRIGILLPENEDNIVYIKRQLSLCEEFLQNLNKTEGLTEKKQAVKTVIKEIKD